jgi:outer membrane receptor protein involved in Fe transport
MNHICRPLCVLFILCFTSVISLAQDSSGLIRGSVSDSISGKPAEFITVALKKDGKVAKTSVTAQNGEFSFTEVPYGAYSLTATATGYLAKTLSIVLSAANKTYEVGNMQLVTQVNTLEGISVTAMRPVIKQEVDRITYDIQADPESKVLTALDMMRKVPLLSLDADDNIKLKGSDKYKILINGKPSSMIDQSPKDVLRGMPASSIQKIEVITTPPAKYDSEGLSGIINIITNKKIDNGYNGSLNIRHQFPVGGPSGSASISFKQGKFGMNAYGGTGLYGGPETEIVNSRITTGADPSSLLNIGRRKFNNNFRYGGADFSFEVDSLNLITAGFNPYSGYNNTNNNQQFSLTSPNEITSYELQGRNRFEWSGLELTFNYQHGFKSNKERLLTFSYKSNNGSNPQRNALTFHDRLNYNDPDYIQQNESRSKEQTIQVDYVHPVGKLNIEAGIKGILRDNSSNFEYRTVDSLTGQDETDPARTNKFNNDQDIIGVYNSYTYTLKNLVFKAGLRMEKTLVKADFISNASNINTDYFNVIPSFSVNRKFNNQSNLNFGFTQRIQRPGIYNMNPFVDRATPNYEYTGNPDLEAVLANNFELTYSRFKKGSVNIGVNYNFANNTIQNVAIYNAETRITRSTYANIGRDKSLTTNLNINYPLTAKWNLTISGNIGYTWLQGVIDGMLTENSGIMGYAYMNTGYKFDKQWRVNASFSYNAATVNLQGKSGEYYYMSFSGSKEILKDKLTLTAGINNPFSKFRYYETFLEGSNFSQRYRGQNYNRSVSISLNWKFGSLKEAVKKSQRSINNDDVKSGAANAGG